MFVENVKVKEYVDNFFKKKQGWIIFQKIMKNLFFLCFFIPKFSWKFDIRLCTFKTKMAVNQVADLKDLPTDFIC